MFGSTGIVDIFIIVCTYVLFLCMGALKYPPVTSLFILKYDCPFVSTTEGV